MKIKKIESSSAFGVGVLFVILALTNAVVNMVYSLAVLRVDTALITSEYLLQALVVSPLVLGVTSFVVVFVFAVAYNKVAKKYPISWDVSK